MSKHTARTFSSFERLASSPSHLPHILIHLPEAQHRPGPRNIPEAPALYLLPPCGLNLTGRLVKSSLMT